MSNLLFTPTNNEYTVFTANSNPRIVEFCDKIEAGFWLSNSVNLTIDDKEWDTKLNDTERDYIKQILAFFAASDAIVNKNICLSFIDKVTVPEVKSFYYAQMFQEAVHSRTYSNLITTFIKDKQEQNKLFDSVNTHSIIKKKADWCNKWMGKDNTFFESLIAFLSVEGIFFSSSFASIFWLRNRGILANSLGVANEYISNDECTHAEFAGFLYKEYGLDEISKETIKDIIIDATELEKEFVECILPDKLSGMNKDLMKQYVEFVADMWLKSLINETQYNVSNPFTFMSTIGIAGKDNFFEKSRTNYTHETEQKDNNSYDDLDLED